MKAVDIIARLKRESKESYRKRYMTFFKTGKGDYSQNDQFIGVPVPSLRKMTKSIGDINDRELQNLISSPIHEARMLALFLLMETSNLEKAYLFYVKNFKYVNNWDLVDCSAHKIVGKKLINEKKDQLYIWAKSKDMWARRISIVSTLYFIKNKGPLTPTLKLAKMFIDDSEDLIHKASGWMLRELGKVDKSKLDNFLKVHHQKMPRVMLRYAIEKHSTSDRKKWLSLEK